MVGLAPVEPSRHAGMGWRQEGGYRFAAEHALVPLVGTEFAKAAVSMPIGFINNLSSYVPVAVLSPLQGCNFFVSPTGQWLGTYIPAALRTYPFRLGPAAGGESVNLLIDEDSGWVVNAGPDAIPFFNEDGTPSDDLDRMNNLVRQFEQNRAQTAAAVESLNEAGIIRPWALRTNVRSREVTVDGLYCVDGSALEMLDETQFLELRRTSALGLAFAQLISTHTVGWFERLDRVQQYIAHQAKPLVECSSIFGTDDDGTISFNQAIGSPRDE